MNSRGAPGPRHLLPALLLFFSLFAAFPSEASETIVAGVTLNAVDKGDFFVRMTEEGDFWVRKADLEDMGLTAVEGETREAGGETYVSLRSLRGVEYVFDEKTLTIRMRASRSLLPTTSVDFLHEEGEHVYYPENSGFFLNYAVNYSDSDLPDAGIFSVSNELGARFRGLLFLTDSVYTDKNGDDGLVRLLSRVIYDRRKELQRAEAGDFIASSGNLGSTVTLGGIRFSKEYRINPYLTKHPLQDVSGFVPLPSEVEVYVNGNRVLRDRFAPGEFRLENISSFAGAGVTEVVLTDPFGKVQRLSYPYYFTTELLKRGLHEYSYGAGFLREEFGLKSNEYGKAAFSFFHDLGVSDDLTLGYRAEGSGDVFNLGPRGLVRLGGAGLVSLSLAGSRDEDLGEWGGAGSVRYEYAGRKINGNINLSAFSEDYATLAGPLAEKTRYIAGAGLGYNSPQLGLLSLSYSVLDRWQGPERRTFTAAVSKSVSNRTTLLARLNSTREDETRYFVFLGVTHRFGLDTYVSAEYEGSEGRNVERLMVRNSAPLGEGVRYRLAVDRTEEDAATAYALSPQVQLNTRYGIFRGDFRWEDTDTAGSRSSYFLSASGGVGFVGGTFGVGRPIRDSFGVVRVGELEGVEVFVNNQKVGSTDSSGKVFVPELSSYIHNQVSISGDGIPVDYSLERVMVRVSPPLRSGSLINFEVRRFQAVAGVLLVEEEGVRRPVGFNDLIVTVEGEERLFPTGRGGEFYLEGVGPGSHGAYFVYRRKKCAFDLTVPESDETLVDLGEVVCRLTVKEAEPAPLPPAQRAETPEGGGRGETEFVYRRFQGYDAFEGTVYFPPNGHIPLKKDEEFLHRVFRLLNHNRVLRAEIEGHADPSGPEAHGTELGLERAKALKERLVAMGLPERKITKVVSFGGSRPVCTGEDEACRGRNRRAYIRLFVDVEPGEE